MWSPNQSLNNLYKTCDPRDQLAQDIFQVQNTFKSPFQQKSLLSGPSPMDQMLLKRQSQLDCRDQEWQDIQMYLNTPSILR